MIHRASTTGKTTSNARLPRHRICALTTLAICTACILLLGPTSVMSNAPKEPSSTMPAPGGGNRFGPRNRSDMREPGAPRPPMLQPPPTSQERDEVIEFFRANTKTRMQMFDQLPEGRSAKNRMLQMMTERYRRLQRIKTDDPAVYDLMLSQMVLQDEALGLLRKQRPPNQEDGANKEEREQELRQKVRQLVDVMLQERQKRVERLEKMLADQKSNLEQDVANPDKLVDQHLAQMKADLDELRKVWPGGRRGMGMGGPERRPPPASSQQAEQGR